MLLGSLKTLNCLFGVALSIIFLSAQPVLAQSEEKPRLSAEQSEALRVPVLDEELVSKAAALEADELIRVLIFLRSEAADREGLASSAAEEDLEAIRAQVKEVLERSNEYRDPSADTDAENYEHMMNAMSHEDRAMLRSLNERHEEVSAIILQGNAQRMREAVSAVQERTKSALEALGAVVNFTTTVGNITVAQVPAGKLQEIAAMEDVARVVEDTLAESHLTVADDATLVTSTMTGGSLWDNSFYGGAYDPAVVDSGTDLSHPFLDASTSREEHFSFYLAAGTGDGCYGDITFPTSLPEEDIVDDLQGHGTHVMGIVASEGSSTYPNHLGMAYGVDKAVHLKAGWYNWCNGRASMYWSDKMWLVDRALNHHDELRPNWGTDVFLDDVDGFNLSYGGETTSDDPAGGQFWDAVIDDYADMVVTISAGNSGPSNTNFSDPATAYNSIAVANVQDQNTTGRTDDIIWSSSTRGPTASGRRKPDIAAPGTDIASANNEWESEMDWIDKTGTSMAAPMVLGVAMDLMDAGVWDEKEIKALLLNTAQKNEAGINFESDADGWSTAYGWGYMNAWAAYYHRDDVVMGSVYPNGTTGDYDLFKGTMRDEGSSGEGRDRATLVWNRHAVYTDHDYPSTVYSLNDLDLLLFSESTGNFLDGDTTVLDNVHQVRVASGAGSTSVVIKVNAFDASFNGVSAESYALATEEDFTAASPPAFNLTFGMPGSVVAGADFTVNVNVTNTGEVASFNNTVTLTLPGDFSVVSGANPQNIGRIAAGATGTATWTVEASTSGGTYWLDADNSSYSYHETYIASESGSIDVGDEAPVIDSIEFDGCISEECTTTLVATAHDPAGGGLTYAWDEFNDGSVDGSGDSFAFAPPGPSTSPACDPYWIKLTVTSSASGLSTEEIVGITVKRAGDANGDGVVNIVDKVMVRNAFGSTGPQPADVNCDNVVNILDKVIVRNQFGQTGCGCP